MDVLTSAIILSNEYCEWVGMRSHQQGQRSSDQLKEVLLRFRFRARSSVKVGQVGSKLTAFLVVEVG